jgi:predicted PurR-regulated permease PerM
MPTAAYLEERRAGYSRLARVVTAVSTTIAAVILTGFISGVQDLVKQAPVLTAHMVATNQKLSSIEAEQAAAKLALTDLLKDYTSREQLQKELEKLNEKIRTLQVQQALIEQLLNGRRRPAKGE